MCVITGYGCVCRHHHKSRSVLGKDMPIRSDLQSAINQQPALNLYLKTIHYEISVRDSNFFMYSSSFSSVNSNTALMLKDKGPLAIQCHFCISQVAKSSGVNVNLLQLNEWHQSVDPICRLHIISFVSL